MQCSSMIGKPKSLLRLGCRLPWRLAFYWETRDRRLEPFVRAVAGISKAVVKEGPLAVSHRLSGEPHGEHCNLAFIAPVSGLLKVKHSLDV